MNVYGITDRGLVRRQNQDCYDSCTLDDAVFAVVCDGMGGARGGNVASQMAVSYVIDAVEQDQGRSRGL